MPSSLQLHPPLAATIAGCRQKQTHQQPTTAATLNRFFPLPCWISLPDTVATYHIRTLGPNQCCSAVVQAIEAPIETVWSIVRRFDNPQAYKQFLKSCQVIVGDGNNVGSLREVHVVSGLPAASSMEKLEILDDERHVLSFSIVGGDHRLTNYKSVTTLHGSPDGNGTVVFESYVVDIPAGNDREDTCSFVDTIVRCNLQSLARVSENIARTEALPAP
ncbi:abscisic acid receptor PYL4-like [Hibiscus syriacus]|nr:abscisic acid receptor PYL4-like [Hibiscus syriacus]